MKFDIRKIANLCRIHLKEDELVKLEKDMQSILTYVESLSALDTENVEPTSHVLNLENVYREDKVVPWNGRDEVLKHAPQSEGKFFKVPKIVDKESS